MLRMNEQVVSYLTEEAQAALKIMLSKGLDEDVALAVLEQLWPDEAIYELPEE